jgi:hypothetical protein
MQRAEAGHAARGGAAGRIRDSRAFRTPVIARPTSGDVRQSMVVHGVVAAR